MSIENIKQAFAEEFVAREGATSSLRYSKSLKRAIAELVTTGTSIFEINKELGISISAVNKWTRQPKAKAAENGKKKDFFLPLKVIPNAQEMSGATMRK